MIRMVIPLFLLLLSGAGGATGSGVTGQVRINSEPVASAVVYLEPADGRPLASAPEEKTILQENLRFHPDFLVVPVGTTIRFENRDDEIHNIRSNARANRFDTGAHMPGTVKNITLKNPGAVPLRCRTHDEMRGLIYVAPSPFFTVTDEHGRFAIKDLPPGSYRITAWHSRLSPEEQVQGALDLRLDSDDRTVSLRFSAKTEAGADLTEIQGQDWHTVVDQIQTDLDKAIALWKNGGTTPATSKVLSTRSRLYGESGLQEAIATHLGKDRAEAHEHRLDLFRKQIQGISGTETTEAALQEQAGEIVRELRRDAEEFDR